MTKELKNEIKTEIKEIATRYKEKLGAQIKGRIEEMKSDDNSHYLIYSVLGITQNEGGKIDEYQNTGRFLYKYAGSFLEEVVILCFKKTFNNAIEKVKIENTIGTKPKKFEIDLLIEDRAYEIKWRDATTDGDHITKEHTRIKNIEAKGYTPIRIMFYYPNREQAKKIQATLKTLYLGVNGEYYSGEDAWEYVYSKTKINLKEIMEEIARENERETRY